VPSGAVVRLVARHARVEVQIEAPEAADSGEPRLPSAQALPVAERVMTLKHRLLEVKQACSPLNLRKSALLERSTQPGFWDQRSQARTIMDEIYRLDSILGMVDAFDQQVHAEQERFKAQHGSDAELSKIDERMQALEGELVHLGFLVQCRNAQQLGDALVTLTRVASHGSQLAGVERLAQMYCKLARRRGLQLEVLDDRQGGDPPEDTITLLLSGAGAYALLGGETGLHQVAGGKKEVRGAKKRYTDREVVRVEVLPVPVEEAAFQRDDLRLESKTLDGVKGRLMARPKHALQLFHVPSMTSARAWMDGSRSEAIAKLKRVLQARLQNGTLEQAASMHPHAPLVRRYTLGPASLVRDLRTGKSTGRLDLVFEGRLEAFLAPPA
jgi:peptide chain release factor 2